MNLFLGRQGRPSCLAADGDRFEVITRFASRYALQWRPKFTPTGAMWFFGSRRLDHQGDLAPGRGSPRCASLNMRNVAVSGDGRWSRMAANYLPHSLALFDADLNLVTNPL